MAKALVLGGCGAVGSVAAKTLAATDAFDHVIIADIDEARAAALAAELGDGVSALRVDAGDRAGVGQAASGCQVLLNCSGPFYRFAVPVAEASIQAGTDYVDVCDDVDATLDLLAMDERARAAGVRALVGMGNSPGVTNLLARFAADHLLDQVESIDIYHAHGGEPYEGPGVVSHRFHGMASEIPVYLDGKLETVRFFEPEGVALRKKISMHMLGDDIPVYPYPHPEQITIPHHIRTRQVTNRGTVLPDEYFQLTMEMCRLGLDSVEPLQVGSQAVQPHHFAVAWLLRQRERILRECDFGEQRGCAKVVVAGLRHGKPRSYVFSMASTDQALGEGTGIPAAMGAILMQRGMIAGPGVLPPEAAVNPLQFMGLVGPVMAASAQGGSFEGFLVERIDENGVKTRVDMPL